MRRAPQHAAGLASLAVGKQDPKILQDFLALKFALSRRTAKAMIDGRNVWVDRKCVWIARYALKTGDIVEIPQSVVKGAQKQSAQTAAKDGRQPAAEGRAQQRDAAAKRHVRSCGRTSTISSATSRPGSSAATTPRASSRSCASRRTSPRSRPCIALTATRPDASCSRSATPRSRRR